jgi:hypothetical protein
VLDRVMQQTRRQDLLVKSGLGEDLGDRDDVVDVGPAVRLAVLPFVAVGRQTVGLPDHRRDAVAVDPFEIQACRINYCESGRAPA